MAVAFAEEKKVGNPPTAVQKILDENASLIQTISEYQNAGRSTDALTLQQSLHRNLLYLAGLADSLATPDAATPPEKLVPQVQDALPPPPKAPDPDPTPKSEAQGSSGTPVSAPPPVSGSGPPVSATLPVSAPQPPVSSGPSPVPAPPSHPPPPHHFPHMPQHQQPPQQHHQFPPPGYMENGLGPAYGYGMQQQRYGMGGQSGMPSQPVRYQYAPPGPLPSQHPLPPLPNQPSEPPRPQQ